MTLQDSYEEWELAELKEEHKMLCVLAHELASNSMSFIDYIRNGDNKRAMTQMFVLESLASDVMNKRYKL
jgi:hypothetical protein